MLSVRDLTVQFDTDDGRLQAATHVSFDVATGGTLGLVGESGCGKSVSAMSIPRLIPQPPGHIVSGEILLDGIDLLKLPISEMRNVRGRDIGVIFQEPMTALSPLHRIGDQLAEVVELHEHCSKRDLYARCLDWLKKVGIPDAEKLTSSSDQIPETTSSPLPHTQDPSAPSAKSCLPHGLQRFIFLQKLYKRIRCLS